MTPIGTILAATDLSPRSDQAIRRAARLAREQGARLVIQHVVDDALPADIAPALVDKATARLRDMAVDLSPDEPAEVEVSVADPRQAVHAYADRRRADLIVLGLHRPRPIMDLIRETTMEHLVRTALRPVLLVRNWPDAAYASVLAAIDTGPAATRALHMALALAPEASVASFYAYHVPFKGLTGEGGTEKPPAPYLDEAEAEIDTWLATAGLPARAGRPTPLDAGPRSALEAMRHKTMPDLITLGAHGRPALVKMVIGSLATDLIRDPPCDLLVAGS